MIDHLKIVFDTSDAEHWKDKIGFEKSDGIHRFEGHLKNIKIVQSYGRVSIFGSLGKYLKGDNVQMMTKSDVRKALYKMQEDLEIDFSKGKIADFEIGSCEIMKNECSNYLKLFGYFGRYTRNEIGKSDIESIEYYTKSGNIGFCIYDKKRELLDKGYFDNIPDYYKDKNLLRMELRFKKPSETFKDSFLRKQKIKRLKPFDLFDDNFYAEVVNRYFKFYSDIQKTGQNIYLDISKSYTPKELKELWAEAFRQLHSKEYAESIIKANLSDKNKENLRTWEKQNSKSPIFSDRNDLIKELDELIKNRCIGYLTILN